ncbi:hypothetical protein [Phytoactinopolyspora limicola]|uniref:hypothetical protein n=1 Tax=Phytoactinopolyspora limicola TaxID=2715536 RepID=UPI00140D42CD|nr:hypothetical protein [Phytoactinopolyspora limicola]
MGYVTQTVRQRLIRAVASVVATFVVASVAAGVMGGVIDGAAAAQPAHTTADTGPGISSLHNRVDQIVHHLADDPVYVDRAMGNGDAEALRAALRAEIDALPYPAYAVLVHYVPGDDLLRDGSGGSADPAELAALLHRRLGEDGVYVVGIEYAVSGIAAGVDVPDPARSWLAIHDAAQAAEVTLSPGAQAVAQLRLTSWVDDLVSPEADAAAAEIIDELLTQPVMVVTEVDFRSFSAQRELTTPPWPTSSRDDSYLGTGFIVAIVVAALANVVLGRRAAGRAITGSPTDIGPARERLATALASIDGWKTDVSGPDGSAVPPVAWRAADAARRLRDSTDPADIMGAAVLAEHAVYAASHTDPPPGPQPCFLHPLHGPHRTTAELPGQRQQVRVPVCQRCADDLSKDHQPDVFRLRRGWRVIPYYRRPDVWAVSGYGSLRADLPDLVLAGARAGTPLPGRLAHEPR